MPVSRSNRPAPPQLEAVRPPLDRRFLIAQLAALVVTGLMVVSYEIVRAYTPFDPAAGPLGWLIPINIDTTPYAALLIVLPLFWFLRRTIYIERTDLLEWLGQSLTRHFRPPDLTLPAGWRTWGLAIVVAGVSWAVAASIGNQFGDVPPGIHDEFAYLFQAKTFLAGQVVFPSHPTQPRLFDQMHILNDGRYVGRYFPGTALWMLPWVAIQHPYWGHYLAGAITAFFIFWTGRILAGNAGGFLAGLLVALSPGMALFGNMLVAHHPGLAGLSLFLYAFLLWWNRNTGGRGWLFLAGIGLAFAMLCRPMTAAGFALPMGIAFFWRLAARREATWLSKFGDVATLGSPLAAGVLLLGAYQAAVMGTPWESPYQRFTDLYTPRHVYGFNNAVRGDQIQGATVLPPFVRKYNQWAENLTLLRSLENMSWRFTASLRWTLALIPLLAAGLVYLILWPAWERGSALVAAAIVSLHLAHIPYWFVGMMGWHYVFETGPLWALLFSVVTARLIQGWVEWDRLWMLVWWGLMIFGACLMNLGSLEPFWESRISGGVIEGAFSRFKHAAFLNQMEQTVVHRPALVLIEHDPADLHIEYVDNPPDLQAPILRGRFDPGETDLRAVANDFPDRALYLFHVAENRWELLALPAP